MLHGRVLDGEGVPVSDALVEIWQADADGAFSASDDGGFTGFGRCLGDSDGHFAFTTVQPGRVDADQAPAHRHVGVRPRAAPAGRHPRVLPGRDRRERGRPGARRRSTPDRRATLVAMPDSDGLRFDVHLAGESETVFFIW